MGADVFTMEVDHFEIRIMYAPKTLNQIKKQKHGEGPSKIVLICCNLYNNSKRCTPIE